MACAQCTVHAMTLIISQGSVVTCLRHAMGYLIATLLECNPMSNNKKFEVIRQSYRQYQKTMTVLNTTAQSVM